MVGGAEHGAFTVTGGAELGAFTVTGGAELGAFTVTGVRNGWRSRTWSVHSDWSLIWLEEQSLERSQ